MIKNNRLHITVAIPAYNEEKNIGNLIDQIVVQSGDSFVLDGIVVVSDGSNDDTVKIVKEKINKYKLLKVIDSPVRLGKIHRLNQIYKLNKSPALLILDADILLENEKTLEKISKFCLNNSDAEVIAIHQIPIRPKNFVGRCIYAGYQFWDIARLSVKNQDHIQNLYGAATLYRKNFSDKFSFPKDITDDRGYLYIKSKEKEKFRYYMGTCIYYLPVSTIHDFWKLSDRSFNKNEDILAKRFGPMVYNLYHIPFRLKIKGIFITFIHNPIYTIFGLLLNYLVRIFPTADKLYGEKMWEISTSTKKKVELNA